MMSDPASTVSIVLERAELRVNVGEHPWERHPQHPSRLVVDVALSFGYRAYFEEHGGYVDYDPLRAFLIGLQGKPHVAKLETLGRQILAACFSLTPAARVRLKLTKPEIFPEMAGVGLEFDVAREEFT
jgi:dihydroneopterin aldolase